jgi:hypothetical protein|tara:strand:+ start:227 stop:1144 length:918 start_codon:yes stop_codon:yes gene_type:complete
MLVLGPLRTRTRVSCNIQCPKQRRWPKVLSQENKLGILVAEFEEHGMLGMSLGDHRHGTRVASVQQGSPAAIAGVLPDAFVVGVNNDDVGGFDTEAVEVLINTARRPLVLTFQKPETYTELVARFVLNAPLGISLATDREGTRIVRVAPDSAAALQGVREGSRLVAVNSEDVSHDDHITVTSMIDSCPRPLTLHFKVPDAAPPPLSQRAQSESVPMGMPVWTRHYDFTHESDHGGHPARSQGAVAHAAAPPRPAPVRVAAQMVTVAHSPSRFQWACLFGLGTTTSRTNRTTADTQRAVRAGHLVV